MRSIFWLSPLAWLGLTAIAVPIVVHLLAHRRAQRVAFPTLRFLQPTRLAAIRRRALEDVALLAVRSAIVVAGVAAFAGPLLVTSARQAQWNQRLVTETVGSSPLSEGIHRAVARLESAPPARRELMIAAPLTIGSLTAGDLALVPPHVGIRFTRTGNLPATRAIEAPPLLAPSGVVQRTVVLAGSYTSVREQGGNARVPWPVDVAAPPRLKPTVDAAMAAVMSLRLRVPPIDHRATLVLVDPSTANVLAGAAPIRAPWMADAVARIASDADLRAEADRVPEGLGESRFMGAPWMVIAAARDGRPIASASAAGDRLIVAGVSRDGDLIVPTLLRAIAANLAPQVSPGGAEIIPITDSQLRAWTREPGSPPPPRPETVERDDRRWLWGAVLLLLAIETWMRRPRAEVPPVTEETHARVA